MTKPSRDGLVRLDPEKLQRRLLQVGLSKTRLADTAELSRNTVLKAFRGEGIVNHSAKSIADALELDVNSLVVGGPEAAELADPGEGPDSGEWKIDAYLGPWVTASNQLQFRVCQMRHQFLPERLGRGKWYDLLHLSQRDRESLRDHLLRHAVVCERIGNHPHVASNLSTLSGQGSESWWIVDRWVDGSTLANELTAGPLPSSRLPHLMRAIAEGLKALHEANIVFRELAPSRVILAAENARAVLTDFELAKLLDTGPSVSADWPDDPYRAPEIESGRADVRADLYSWARILVHAGTGELPPKGQDLEAVTRVGLPKSVWRIVTDCLSPGPSDRPQGIDQLMRGLRRWSQ